ncbi:hypothetical protein NMY3_01205 [Candidatus Nitrosocosmicus oleophilus]|uniref:Uncharacterized protein n=1 Tax=Candidatus Nitrosocosmicus oleophilus TaxID=1353260 RepID=A0A654LX64_9ARCH|nr:hypothetical protein [Candidatus Nitrosocosmicus oleophilus]ALI35410.1 hypothetical protein NMY3_01205 [Candidatus Nitrosocosmicus oleophilus]
MGRAFNSSVVTIRVPIKKEIDKLKKSEVSVGTFVNDLLHSYLIKETNSDLIYPYKFSLMDDTMTLGSIPDRPLYAQIYRHRLIHNLSIYDLEIKKHVIPSPVLENNNQVAISRYSSKNITITDNTNNYLQVLFPRSFDKKYEELIIIFPNPIRKGEEYEYFINYENDYTDSVKSSSKGTLHYVHKFLSRTDKYVMSFKYPKRWPDLEIDIIGEQYLINKNPIQETPKYKIQSYSALRISPNSEIAFDIQSMANNRD